MYVCMYEVLHDFSLSARTAHIALRVRCIESEVYSLRAYVLFTSLRSVNNKDSNGGQDFSFSYILKARNIRGKI